MSLTVYVGHSVAEAEHGFLWEFQAHAAAHGVKVQLASYTPVASLTASREHAIQSADAFLAVVTRPSPDVEAEAKYARGQGKPVFVYTLQGVAFDAPAGAAVISVAPGTDAPTLLANVAAQLRQVQPPPQNNEVAKAIGIVVGVGAALFLLAALFKGRD